MLAPIILLPLLAVLHLASSQLVMLPLSSSSSSELEVPAEKLACFESCTMPFLNGASANGAPPLSAMCDIWLEMKECLVECPEGTEMLQMVAKMVPKSFNMIKKLCEESGEGTPGPDAIAAVMQEGAAMEQADVCISDCEQNIDALMTAGMSGTSPDLDEICSSWHRFAGCVTDCPQGAEAMTAVKKSFPSIFNTIESYCGQNQRALVLDQIKEASGYSSTAYYATETSDATEVPAVTGMPEHTENTEATEVTVATGMTEHTEATESTEVPRSTEATKHAMVSDVERFENTEVSSTSEATSGSTAIQMSSAESATESVEDLLAMLLPDSSDAPPMEMEMMNCKGHCLTQLDKIDVSVGTETLCSTWARFTSCLDECPDPKEGTLAILRDLRKIMPKTVEYLSIHCLPGNSAPLDPQLLGEMLAEEQNNDEMEMCIQECEVHVDALRTTMAPSLTDICVNWGNYKSCLNKCPGGAATFDIVRQIMPEMVAFIQDTCRLFPQPEPTTSAQDLEYDNVVEVAPSLKATQLRLMMDPGVILDPECLTCGAAKAGQMGWAMALGLLVLAVAKLG